MPPRFRPVQNIAAIAQLGERQTEDLKVPGSIPGRGRSFLLRHLSNSFTLETDDRVTNSTLDTRENTTTMGFEPTIFRFEVGRLIH